MNREVLGAGILIAICAGSLCVYAKAHRHGDYAQGRTACAASFGSFRHVHTWIRLTTPVAGLGALFGAGTTWFVGRPPTAIFLAGCLLAIGGFVLFVHARRTLGRCYAPCFDAYLPDRIVTAGVYGYIRHPIYTANIATIAGLTSLTGSLVLAANTVLLAVYCVISARREERDLQLLSRDYRQMMSRTGRFLPRLRSSA